MATISHSDLAPDEAVTYSLANAEPFTLEGADATYEVPEPDEESGDERAAYDAILANARAHPWLTVEVPQPEADDSDQAVAVEWPKTAIDAGLDQKETHFEGDNTEVPVAETLAADDAQGDEPIVVDDEDDTDDGEND